MCVTTHCRGYVPYINIILHPSLGIPLLPWAIPINRFLAGAHQTLLLSQFCRSYYLSICNCSVGCHGSQRMRLDPGLEVIHEAIAGGRSTSLSKNLCSTWETTKPEAGCLPSGIKTCGCVYRWPPARACLCIHTLKKPVYKH